MKVFSCVVLTSAVGADISTCMGSRSAVFSDTLMQTVIQYLFNVQRKFIECLN